MTVKNPRLLSPEFQVHMLNDKGIELAGEIAEHFDTLLIWLTGVIPGPSRELSIVKTKLEEACFFSKKAMARQGENQK